MVEAFQNVVMRLAMCGFGVSLVAMALRSRPVRAAFVRMLEIWRGLTAFGRFAVCSFLLVGILVGGDKTNSINNLLPQMLQGDGSFETGFTGLTGLSGPLPHTPSSTNLVNLVNPVQNRFAQRKAENWNARGAWQDSFWLPFAEGWVFPHGSNHLSGVEVVSFGQLWAIPFGSGVVTSIGEPVSIVPGLSSFAYELTPSNSYRFAWTDAAINRDTNNLVSAELEFFRNGDVSVTTNGVAAYLPRELPFPHNGFGQDAEWVTANFTNTTEKATTVVRVGDVLLPSAPADGLVVLTNTPVAMLLDCEPAGSGSFLSTAWHTRRLKSDGSYDEWQLAEYNHHGASIVLTPLLGGIYQIRALASVAAGGADERFYVWEADENRMIGPGKKGEPKSIGVVSHAWQQSLRNCARGFLGSTAYLSTEALPAQYGFPAYPAGDIVFKCNIFVAHRIVQSGLLCPKTRGWFNSYPPLANDWADASYEIGDWVTLSSEGYPEPGYVAADPDPDTSGHMGILDFDGFGISAGMSNVNRHFDTGSSNVVIRKLEE